MEAKFEIKLKTKEAKNGYKKGETVIIVNSIFDKLNGIAFHPIDKNFEIVYYRQFLGIQASGKDLFDGDILSDGKAEYQVWIEQGHILLGGKNKAWDEYISSFRTSKMEVIGNVFDNPELQ